MQHKDPKKPEQDGKQKRLSSALRENLKRRKAAPRPKKAEQKMPQKTQDAQ